jgi:hypothetical protein
VAFDLRKGAKKRLPVKVRSGRERQSRSDGCRRPVAPAPSPGDCQSSRASREPFLADPGLAVVQNVRKNALQLHADAFRHTNGFLDGQIQIPVRQANEKYRSRRLGYPGQESGEGSF